MSARIVDQPRFLSREALMAAAKHVAATHPNERIAIVGGTAAQIWGAPRLTSNLDVIAESDLGYKGEPSTIGGVRTVEGGIELNVITRLDEWARLYEDALYAAVRVEGVPLPVVTPEFLVAMKMVAGRLQDKFDAYHLVLIRDFDRTRATDIIYKHLGRYAGLQFKRLIEEAGWELSRGAR